LDLEKLQRIADSIIEEEDLPADATVDQVEELMLVGTSMGGARPKAVVEDQEGYGWQNSIVRMTNGTMHVLNMQCWFSLAHAGSLRPKVD